MIVIIIKSIIIKSTLAIPSAEKIKSDKKIVCVVKTAYGPGTFLIINKSVNVVKDTTNTSYSWGCYLTITNYTL